MGFAVLAAAALFKEPPVTIATLPERSWVLIASGALVVCPEPGALVLSAVRFPVVHFQVIAS